MTSASLSARRCAVIRSRALPYWLIATLDDTPHGPIGRGGYEPYGG
jgi:hypothetical protein